MIMLLGYGEDISGYLLDYVTISTIRLWSLDRERERAIFFLLLLVESFCWSTAQI